MIMQVRFAGIRPSYTSHNNTVPHILQEYRQIEPNLAHDAVVTFTAANGCTVRQDAVRNCMFSRTAPTHQKNTAILHLRSNVQPLGGASGDSVLYLVLLLVFLGAV